MAMYVAHLVAIWYTYFVPFWYFVTRKIWQPCVSGVEIGVGKAALCVAL
jgi:hypothetical protein